MHMGAHRIFQACLSVCLTPGTYEQEMILFPQCRYKMGIHNFLAVCPNIADGGTWAEVFLISMYPVRFFLKSAFITIGKYSAEERLCFKEERKARRSLETV